MDNYDNRPDWLKAAAYELKFFREQMEDGKKALKLAEYRLNNATDWIEKLAKNLDEHTIK